MSFKLGVVGHRDTLATVKEIVDEYFDGVEIFTEEFGNDEIISHAVERIAKLQTKCDGILYSRRDPYMLISAHLHHIVPVRYVEIDSSHLLISLLRASFLYGQRPTNISIDAFEPGTVIEAYRSIGVPKKELNIHAVHTEIGQEELVNATMAGHLENYQSGAQLCVTNITDVYRSLLRLNIPAIVISPSTESFVHEIRNLILRYRLKSQNTNSLAITHIKLQYKEKYRFYGEMPIREVDELSNAAKLICVFAEKLDGAMFCLSRWEYLIISSRILLETATQNFSDIDLMKQINQTTVFDAAIGIGCGETVKDAEGNAIIAANNLLTQRGTAAMVALSAEELIGPIRPKSEHFTEESANEARLAEIAATTGLGSGVLHRLYQATRKQNSNLFTSLQLAELLQVSTRTVNRMVEKLLDHRYAAIEGKHLAQSRGRPARVIRLLL